jgi:response regulator RpfG family c-di-GMP phosphodiesterase
VAEILASHAVAAGPAAEPGFSVLAVDDEPNILSALRRLLRANGYRVQTAAGGAQALELLQAQGVDLIISDMRMPGMNGAEFLRRSLEPAPQAVRILLTGYADVASTIDAVNQGEIFRYVSKPWDDGMLLRTLDDGLQRKRLERERDQLLQTVTAQHEALKRHADELDRRVHERTQSLSEAHRQLEAELSGTVRMLSNILDQRFAPDRGCGREAAAIVRAIGPASGLAGAALEDAVHAALLESLGRLGLPARLCETPLSELRGEERDLVVKAPQTAEGHLMSLPSLRGAAAVLHHLNERWDGQGEPGELAGTSIPLGSRLLRVVSDCQRLKAGRLESRRFSDVEARRWLQYAASATTRPSWATCASGWTAAARPRPRWRGCTRRHWAPAWSSHAT